MPQRKTRQKKISYKISPALKEYFETGKNPKELDGFVEVFRIKNGPKMEQAWDACRSKFLKQFILKNPCQRPHIFWRYDTVEQPRLQISGKGHGPIVSEYKCLDTGGLPIYWDTVKWSSKNPPVFESQAAYLKRTDLLTAAEKKYLEEHPELLETITITLYED
jgi:hypothetical protein